jgi:hypothetical protein
MALLQVLRKALFLFKVVLFLLPKMADNGVVAAAKYGIAPVKDVAVAAAKDIWQRRYGSCKKCNVAANKGAVAAAKDGLLALLKLLKRLLLKMVLLQLCCHKKTSGKGPVAASKKGIATAIDGAVAAKDGWLWCC